MTRRFGIFTLQHAPLDALTERWRRTEEMGFDSVWIADRTTTQGGFWRASQHPRG